MRRLALLAMLTGCADADTRPGSPFGVGDGGVPGTSGEDDVGETTGAPDGSSSSSGPAGTSTGDAAGSDETSGGAEAGTTEAVGCPADHFCFELPGTFHQPDLDAPDASYVLDVPAGVEYGVVELEVDVTHGGWAQPVVLPGDDTETDYAADGLHGVFWLHRGRPQNFTWAGGVLGYVNVRGPDRDLVRTRHDLDHTLGGAADPDAVFNIGNVHLQEGHTYRFHYRYDTVAHEVVTEVSENGSVIAWGTDVPTAASITSANGFFIVFGHHLIEAGPEVPTLGWTYADLRIELAP